MKFVLMMGLPLFFCGSTQKDVNIYIRCKQAGTQTYIDTFTAYVTLDNTYLLKPKNGKVAKKLTIPANIYEVKIVVKSDGYEDLTIYSDFENGQSIDKELNLIKK